LREYSTDLLGIAVVLIVRVILPTLGRKLPLKDGVVGPSG
jgi:hypothetical protein